MNSKGGYCEIFAFCLEDALAIFSVNLYSKSIDYEVKEYDN